MITDVALIRCRNLFVADLYKGQMGTGTTAETEDDTGLETPVATTLLDITYRISGNTAVVDYNCPIGTGDGSNFAEFEIQLNSGSTNFSRVVFVALTKEADEQFQHIVVLNFSRGR